MTGINIEDLQELHKGFPSLIPLRGKKPFEEGWQQYSVTARPFNPKDFTGCNAGIMGGPANGVIILDADHVPKFNKFLKDRGLKLHETRTHLTGSGKPHYFYQYPNNGHVYGNRSFKDPEGELDPKTGKVITVFDVKAMGGQVVAPGSIHPDTGKKYTVHNDAPIAPAPEWLLDFCRQREVAHQPVSNETPTSTPQDHKESEENQVSLPYPIKKLITEGDAKGKRSEAIMSVINALVRAKMDDAAIIGIFESNPLGIGAKYLEVGRTREKWLLSQVAKARQGNHASAGQGPKKDIAATVKTYLLDEFDGGIFKLSDLRRELGLNDYEYTLARNCVKRMVNVGALQKHGQQMGCYRVVDRKKKAIDFEATEAGASKMILPGKAHEVVTIRDGDMVCIAGFKNQIDIGRPSRAVPVTPPGIRVSYHGGSIELSTTRSGNSRKAD